MTTRLALLQRRAEGVARLLDSDFVVFAEVSRRSGSSVTVSLDGFVWVRIDEADIIKACPLARLLELDGGGPLEG